MSLLMINRSALPPSLLAYGNGFASFQPSGSALHSCPELRFTKANIIENTSKAHLACTIVGGQNTLHRDS
jgi:hypothetical protein